MTLSVRKKAMVVFAALVVASLRCVSLQSPGGTGDETIIGRVVNEDGTPAGSTVIVLRPFDYDPVSGNLNQDSGIDTTNGDGEYSVTLHSPKMERFTLQATSLPQRTRTIVPGIAVASRGGTSIITTAVLRATGTIKVVLSDSTLSNNGYAFIPGTSFQARMENGYAVIDSVPAEMIDRVYYNDGNGPAGPKSMAESIDVKPGIPTIVAFSGSSHSAKITMNTTAEGADVAETVAGFPVLVRLSADNFNFNQARTDGSDIRFTKPDNTPLPYEIERWDAAARLAEIWVKVDTVYGNNGSQFMVMYWGEPATVIVASEARVFDTTGGFRGVWHLAEESADVGTKGLYRDATGRNNGDDFVSATDRSGIIGYGRAFDGIDDYITVNSPVTDFQKGDVTIALWVNIEDSAGTILSKLDSTLSWNRGATSLYFGDGTDAHLSGANPSRPSNGRIPSFVGYNNDYAIAGQPIPPNGWYYLVYSWKWHGDSTGTSRYFIDGNEIPLSKDSLTIRFGESVHALLRIGMPNNNESIASFKGSMDQLEISAVARSADWIRLTYMNQRQGNFLVRFY